MACLLAMFFVSLDRLDAELMSLALSPGSTEDNPLAAGFGFDPVLKEPISTALIIPLLVIRCWRAIVLLCADMSGVVVWNTIVVLRWL